MSAHGITLTGYCARWASGLIVEPLGTWDSTGQEQLAIESASDEWQGVITATFWAPGAETGTDMLMDGGTCIVPPEALAAPGNGTVTLRCTNAVGRRISVDLAYHSAGHAQVPGSPSEPTPDLWQQYVEQVAADADRAEQASKDAAKSAEAAAESAKQAAQATADISEAKDDALEAIQQAQDTGVQAIQQAHQAALDDIATDRQQALTDIETEGEKQTSAITSNGAAALEAIGQVEQTAIGQVQQAGQNQQTAIEQAGQSWQQQIAAAGTAELGRWAPAIWDTTPLAAEQDIYAAEGAPLRVTQQGETEQETTTGAQLFDIDSGEPEDRHDGILAFACPLEVGEKYTLSTNGKASIKYKISNSRDGYTSAGGTVDNEATFTMAKDEHIADNEQQYMYFWLADGNVQVTDKSQISSLDIMLNAGSTALPWEPYTGGAPSPSPDYPQAIKGTGLGKSLTLDPDHKTSAWSFGPNALQTQPVLKIHQLGLPFGQQGGIFCNQYRGSTTVPMEDKSIFTASSYFGDYITIRDSAWASLEDAEADLRARIAAGNPCIVCWRADDGTDYTVGISTEDDAGGYHGQALAIGSPLYGDGSVVDMAANYVPSGCDKAIVLDGSEDEDWRLHDETGYRFFYLTVPPLSLADSPVGHANRYPYVVVGRGGENAVYLAGETLVRLQDATISSVDALKISLAANPLKIWYRSTAYTEAADLHIDKVTRRWRMVELDGTEEWTKTAQTGVDEWMLDGVFAPYAIKPARSSHFAYTNIQQIGSFYINAQGSLYIRFAPGTMAAVSDLTAWLAAQKSAGTPVRVLYQLATPEKYAGNPHTLPALGSLPETVKATGESTVEYSADTKSYINAKFAALSAAMLGG